jgi:hypothetical protein
MRRKHGRSSKKETPVSSTARRRIPVAGNVCSGDEIGSVEYGVLHVKTPLLVVMGHSKCGAVTAVVKGLNLDP